MQQSTYQINKILLIDDDEDEQLIFQIALENIAKPPRLSYINSFYKKVEGQACDIPDIAFVDINMPGEDGFRWVKKLRAAGYTFPIVMFSHSQSQDNIDAAFKAGANLYLHKPNSFEQLSDAVETIMAMDWMHPERISGQYLLNGRFFMYS